MTDDLHKLLGVETDLDDVNRAIAEILIRLQAGRNRLRAARA